MVHLVVKLGYGCDSSSRVSQDVRDIILLERIILTLGCGKIRGPYSDITVCDIHVKGIEDISDKIIPFFITILYMVLNL